MGHYTKAEPLLQRALKIWERALGPEHPRTSTALNNLALLYHAVGDYGKAEPLLQLALKIAENVLGPEHPNTAGGCNNLAGLYHAMGDYAKAEPLYQRALKIREKVPGPEHADTAQSFNNLAFLSFDLRRVPIAIEFALKCEQARVSEVAAILSFTSEQQRTAYQASRGDPCALFGTLGQARETAAAVLHRKGMVLDSLLEDRLVMQASHDPEDRARIAQLRAGKQRLTQLLFEVPKDVSPEARQRREAERNKLANEVEELEKTLARRVAGLGRARRALSVTVEQV